jgi:hypothetical protein
MQFDHIIASMHQAERDIKEAETALNRALLKGTEDEATIARLSKENAELKDELQTERQLGNDAQKQLDAFKAQLTDFLA